MAHTKVVRQTQKMIDTHSAARSEYDRIQTALSNERAQSFEDRRFCSIPGAQWEGKYGEQFENKPKIEINKVHLSVIRIYNEYRNNRITAKFVPKTGEDDSTADTLNGLYRADEEDSTANEAYDNAFDEGTTGGIGAWRIRTEYEDEYDEDNEYQRVRFEPIFDADTSVYFDLNAKTYDKSDATRAYIIYSMTRDSFIEMYKEDPATWPKDDFETTFFDWNTPDVIYLAEYYEVEEVNETIHIYQTLDGVEEKYRDADFDNDETLEETLESIGTFKISERKVKTRKVHKYIMTGSKILEDHGFIAGRNIPIVPFYGKRWFIDNIERCMGQVRLAKDPQRLKNMQTSKLAEISALSSVEKPIFSPEQISGHENAWESDNLNNYAYLLANPATDKEGNPVAFGPVSYTKVPNVPPAMAALLQITDIDMKEILGNQQMGDEINANTSGKAVELVQTRLDMQTFIYMSNMAKSIKRSGEIWLDMVKDIFVEDGRKMKTVGQQGEISTVELNKPVMDKETGEVTLDNDLSKGKFDVAVNVGPSSDSKRSATLRSIIDMMKLSGQDPETMQVLTSMAMMNMEGEGISDARDFFRQKMVRMGVVKPTEEEMQQLSEEQANQAPNPNDELLKAAAQKETAEAQSLMAKTQLTMAQVKESETKSVKNQADAAETLSGIKSEEEQRAIDARNALGTPVQ
jgi:hypothetical protein